MTTIYSAQSNLLDYMRHFASSKEITALAFGLESLNYSHDVSAMHIGRARMCCQGMMDILCELRDQGKIDLTLDIITEYAALDKLIELYQLSDDNLDSNNLKCYLADLPDIETSRLSLTKKPTDKSYKLHDFYQACIAEKMGMLFHLLRQQ